MHTSSTINLIFFQYYLIWELHWVDMWSISALPAVSEEYHATNAILVSFQYSSSTPCTSSLLKFLKKWYKTRITLTSLSNWILKHLSISSFSALWALFASFLPLIAFVIYWPKHLAPDFALASCHALPHPILSSFVLSYPLLSYPILSYPLLSYLILSYPILSYPILSCPISSHSILSYPHYFVCPLDPL